MRTGNIWTKTVSILIFVVHSLPVIICGPFQAGLAAADWSNENVLVVQMVLEYELSQEQLLLYNYDKLLKM